MTITYSVLYWNPVDAQWRGTGNNNLPTVAVARQRMNALSEQCNHCCTFRVEQM